MGCSGHDFSFHGLEVRVVCVFEVGLSLVVELIEHAAYFTSIFIIMHLF